MANYVLLISCPDQVGLIHRVTGILLQHSLNIIENGEYVDHSNQMFFMRTEFSGTANLQDLERQMRALLAPHAHLMLTEKRKKRAVILASKEHHCLGDLLLRHEYGELNADILGVVSQHDSLRPLVERFHLPFTFVPHAGLTREAHEAALLKVLVPYQAEYLVLAKYMRILSADFVRHYENRIINIHHSFLPAFVGQHPYKQAFERGVKIIGATAHFVNDKLDEGPIITQSVLPTDHKLSVADMTQAGRDVEKTTLANALKLAFDDRILIHNQRTIIFN